jgi:hypothetical protein
MFKLTAELAARALWSPDATLEDLYFHKKRSESSAAAFLQFALQINKIRAF